MNDQQRKRVYDAEARVARSLRRGRRDAKRADLDPLLEESELESLAARVCEDRELPPVLLVFVDEGADAIYRRARCTIDLPPWARTPSVLLHELAHHGTPPFFQSHGAEFIQLFLELLETYSGEELARLHRVAFEDDKNIHLSLEDRVRRVRRNAVNFANQAKAGKRVRVELACDDPPELIEGFISDAGPDGIVIDGRTVPLDRGRYITMREVQ